MQQYMKEKTLLNFLRPIVYNNPTILESIANKESYLRGFFKVSISNLKRCYGSLHLSNLQNIINTHRETIMKFLKFI